MKSIAVYARKSVEVKDSVSIETQIDMCKNYFADEECKFEVFSDDGFSGGNTNRPAFKLLNKKIKLNIFNAVVCYKLDRISRRVLDMADFFELLESKNISFICVKDKYDTATPMGRAMLYFASVFAQLERETIAERVKDAMLNLAKKGCFTGGPAPKGYKTVRIDGKTYLRLDDKDFINDLFYSYLNSPSLYALNNKVNKYFNYDPKNTQGWRIRYILESPLYVQSTEKTHEFLKQNGWEVIGKPNGKGYLTYNVNSKEQKMAIVSKHEAIVDDDTWIAIQERLKEVSEKNLKRTSKTYWLSNSITCPYCGGKYILANSGRNTYYVCSNRLQRFDKSKDKCKNNKYVNADKLEANVNKILEVLSKEDIFKEEYSKSHSGSKGSKEIKKIEKDIQKNETMISNLIDKLAMLSNEAGKLISNRIENLTKKNAQLKLQLENQKMDQLETTKFSEDFVYKNIQESIKTKDLKKKRILIKNIFSEISYDSFKKNIEISLL